jgi:ABC-type glycerol-3-phosphate transport system substrate-binding protein
MRKSKFVWTVLLVAIALVISVSMAGAKESEKQIVLRVPHWFWGHGTTFEEWIKGGSEEFEKQNPNVKIDGYQVPYDQYWDKIDTSIAAGDPADVFALTNNNLGKYVQNDAIIPLDNLINMKDVKSNWSAIQTEGVVSCAGDGKTYLLITNYGFYLPMYRPSVFKKAGISAYAKTPDEFLDMCKKLKGAGTFPYASMILPGNWTEGQYDLYIWVFGLGGNYAKNGKPTLNSPEVIKAIAYLKKLFDAGYMPKETDKGTYRKMFGVGQVGTLIDGPWMYGLSVSWDPAAEKDFATANLPFPTQKVATFFEGMSVSKKTKNPKMAAKYVEFMCSPEQQKRLVDIITMSSARKDIYKDKAFLDKVFSSRPWFKNYVEHTDQVMMNAPGIDVEKLPELIKIWYSYYERVLYENMDPTKAMNDAQDEAMALFQ